MESRNYTLLDHLITQFDRGLSAAYGHLPAKRPNPAENLNAEPLSSEKSKHSAGLMRVNHCGEICAQALYHAQALLAKDPKVHALLLQSADEETDHLAWTFERLTELNSHRTVLGLFWYWHSFMIGLLAGMAGDGLSLGFVEETEIQVGRHLEGHLQQLAHTDEKSAAIIRQMQNDEARHADHANQRGAHKLPEAIKIAMRLQAKWMTTVTYWI